jgi:pumilio family protein 6
MSVAITTKNAMSGTKRKVAPVKDAHVKGSKKPKIDTGLKSTMKPKSKQPVKIVEESSDSEDSEDSEDTDSDGGAPLYSEPAGSSVEEEADQEDDEEDEEESDSEPTLKVADGLHPDRAKAVVTNSESLYRF